MRVINVARKYLPLSGDERGQQDLDDEGDVSGNEERLRHWAKVLADAGSELGL